MGSPVSVVLAEIAMQRFENQMFANAHYQLIIWKGYVDDAITALPTADIDTFLAYINTINQYIKFTFEKEENCLPFLDLLCNRKPNGSLTFNVYFKPTHTNQYLNYESYHPE